MPTYTKRFQKQAKPQLTPEQISAGWTVRWVLGSRWRVYPPKTGQTEKTRVCRDCEQEKPIGAFSRTRHWYYRSCKACRHELVLKPGLEKTTRNVRAERRKANRKFSEWRTERRRAENEALGCRLPPEGWLGLIPTALELGVSEPTVRRYAREGLLGTVRSSIDGLSLFFDPGDVAWLASFPKHRRKAKYLGTRTTLPYTPQVRKRTIVNGVWVDKAKAAD